MSSQSSISSLTGELTLGSYPKALPRLIDTLTAAHKTCPRNISMDVRWFDLTMLAWLALSLRNSDRPRASVTLNFSDQDKYPFLWRSGFFTTSRVAHDESPFDATPDIWSSSPTKAEPRANFTSLIPFDAATASKDAKDHHSLTTKSTAFLLLKELRSTVIYPHIHETDLMASKEYLHVVLWELIENVLDHSRGRSGLVAAQVFSSNIFPSHYELSALTAQYDTEVRYSRLPVRTAWLKAQAKESFLLLTCVDDGIGIPDSMRTKRDQYSARSDSHLLDVAFERTASSRNNFHHRFAVHGLHLIRLLIECYQGYLFVQSGNAYLEMDGSQHKSTSLTKDRHLAGTMFQVLLPFSAGNVRQYYTPKPRSRQTLLTSTTLYVAEECRRVTSHLPPHPKDEEAVVQHMVTKAEAAAGLLFLDFVGMPRERQFVSLLLLCVRRRRAAQPTIVLNASEELFTAIAAIRSGENAEDLEQLCETDTALGSELSRGDPEALLPMIVPITRLSDDKKTIAVQWLGLGTASRSPIHRSLLSMLDSLFYAEGALTEDELNPLPSHERLSCQALTLLHSLRRVNPDLLHYSPKHKTWHLCATASKLYHSSIIALQERLDKHLGCEAKYNKPRPDVIFFLNWRSPGLQYVTDYYELWPVVSDLALCEISARLLLRLAEDHPSLGPLLSTVQGLVSVTASAGQLARAIARIIGVSHWEASSVYDLDDAEWPSDFGSLALMIVDDIIDTGTTSKRIIEQMAPEKRNGNVIAILSLLQSSEGGPMRAKSLPVPVLAIRTVSLGRPSQEEVSRAKRSRTILEVDPHTLEPQPIHRFQISSHKTDSSDMRDLALLVRCDGLRSGHFVYGGHHYYHFFDLVSFSNSLDGFQALCDWFKHQVRTWHAEVVRPIAGSKAPVSLIYPYYSAVGTFVHMLTGWLEGGLPFPCSIVVARPFQRSNRRLGYRLDGMDRSNRFAAFLDDGIASGGTLSAILDAFVALHTTSPSIVPDGKRRKTLNAAFLALPIFDRIGLNPRKHLKSAQRYRGGVGFRFRPRFSLSLRSFHNTDCPLCLISRETEHLLLEHAHLADQLHSYMRAVLKSLAPTFSTAVGVRFSPPPRIQLASEDLPVVALATDALFSDRASGADIKASIADKRKGPVVRLEILLNAAMDPILYRMVHDDEFFIQMICNSLWSAGVSDEYRCYFLLHIPYFASQSFSQKLLFDAIPNGLQETSVPISMKCESDWTPATLALYFNTAPTVFSSLILACWILWKRVSRASRDTYHWFRALKHTPYEYLFASAMCANKEQVARHEAQMLLCNFVFSYSTHSQSYLYKLRLLSNDLAMNFRSNEFPEHLMTYIARAITSVSNFFNLQEALLPDAILHDLLRWHSAWLQGDDTVAPRLKLLIEEWFAPNASVNQAKMSRRLKESLIAKSSTIVTLAISHLNQSLRKRYSFPTSSAGKLESNGQLLLALSKLDLDHLKVENSCSSTRVLANACSVASAVANLLENAWNAIIKKGEPVLSVPESLRIRVQKASIGENESVHFQVFTPVLLTSEMIAACFQKGGGLMAERLVIESWGGKMDGVPQENGQTMFFVALPSIGDTAEETS